MYNSPSYNVVIDFVHVSNLRFLFTHGFCNAKGILHGIGPTHCQPEKLLALWNNFYVLEVSINEMIGSLALMLNSNHYNATALLMPVTKV